MKIEKIKKLGSSYKIILDNGQIIDTFSEVILNNNLLYNKEIDKTLIDKINSDNLYYNVYNEIVKKINRHLKSKYEVKEYLKKTDISKENSEKMIKELEQNSFIDDERYARAYISDKMNLTMDGPIKILKALDKLEIDFNMANKILKEVPQEIIDERIDKIVTKRIKNNKMYSAYMLQQKTIQYLIKLGYTRTDIDKHLYKITTDKKLMEKSMDKVFKKLSERFSGENLKINLKNKLYQRGFKVDDINEYLNKKQF